MTFAGIRTDSRLREIDRTSLTIRLRNDVIPSPEAVITHCLTPEDLSGGLCEYQAALKLHELFNTPGTVSLGYNSFGFDDEFLRFLFYRNLLDPYTHQYAGGCSRADMLPVTALFHRFCDPPLIRWPRLGDGTPTLKLEHIARANQFETAGPAHDAMSDVQALVQLCRGFAERADIWEYALGFFDKPTDLKRMQAIAKTSRIGDRFFRTALMVSSTFGSTAGYLAPVLHIGGAVPYANQQLWVRLDRSEFGDINPETRRFDWFPIRKKPADVWLILPPLERFTRKLTGTARQTAADVLSIFRKKYPVFQETVQAHREFVYPWIPDLDPDAALYQDGFFTVAEKRDIARFHDAAPFDTADAVRLSRLPATLQTPRVQTLAARILFRNYRIPASPEFQAHLEKLSAGEKIAGFRGEEKLTLPQARAGLKDIVSKRDTLSPRQCRALDHFRASLREWRT